MYLFFDTETSGLPGRYDAPSSDIDNWPRIVQLAWIAVDSKGRDSELQVRLIKPDGFKIDAGAARTHGITTKHATAHGVELPPVLKEFAAAVRKAKVIVAHNSDFDSRVVGAEYIRANNHDVFHRKSLRCTMKEATDYCRLPGNYGFKWPKLEELYAKLFEDSFDEAHDAGADTMACMRCFFRLKELGVM